MGYYQGDYYRGDYYQGFPFIGAALAIGRKVLPKVAGRIGGAIGRAVSRKGAVKTAGKVLAGGAVFEAGSQIVRRATNGDDDAPKRRRMNVGNVKALRRAIRRAHGFAKLSRKVLTFPISRPPKGRPLFKKARRK